MKNKTNSKGFVLWVMGPTSSGKTTISEQLLLRLRGNNVFVMHYDGDEVRSFLGPDHGFSKNDRLRVVSTIVHLSNKALEAGACVIVSALTANPDARAYVMAHVHNLLICSVECSLERCMKRDPKGLYAKAREGKIDTLIGYNEEYMYPEKVDIVINTENENAEQCVDSLYDTLKMKSLVKELP